MSAETKKACKDCYKSVISIDIMAAKLDAEIVKMLEKKAGGEVTIEGKIRGAWRFTPNHDECDCCREQLAAMKREAEKAKNENPGFPEYLFRNMVRCCCDDRRPD